MKSESKRVNPQLVAEVQALLGPTMTQAAVIRLLYGHLVSKRQTRGRVPKPTCLVANDDSDGEQCRGGDGQKNPRVTSDSQFASDTRILKTL